MGSRELECKLFATGSRTYIGSIYYWLIENIYSCSRPMDYDEFLIAASEILNEE